MLGHHWNPWHSNQCLNSTKQSVWLDQQQHTMACVCIHTQQHETSLSLSLGETYHSLCKEGRLDRALELLKEIEKERTFPLFDSYILFLKQCIKRKALIQAKGMYTHLSLHGLESNCSLSEYLVSAFVKCGDIDGALRIFCALPCDTVFCWTAILSGFTDCGKGEEALKLYEYMLEAGVEPNEYTFVSLLKACASIHAMDEGKTIHADARRMGFDSNSFVLNTLVSMYIKCGSFVEAEEAFQRLSMQKTTSWNVMLSAYVEQGEVTKALLLFRQMQEECVRADNRTFVYALQACCVLAEKDSRLMPGSSSVWGRHRHESAGPDMPAFSASTSGLCAEVPGSDASIKAMGLDIGQAIHAGVRHLGLQSDVFVGTSLISMYGKCGSLLEAENVFSGLSEKNIVTWNAMLSVYVDHSEGEKALRLFEQMVGEGAYPEVRTYVICLQACCIVAEKEVALIEGTPNKHISLEIGEVLHACVSRKSFDSNMFVCSALISMYGKCGCITEAEKTFDGVPHSDTAVWNSMLSAYVEVGEGEKASRFYQRMQEVGENTSELTLVIASQAHCLRAEKAADKQAATAFVDSGRALHGEAVMKGFEQDLFVNSSLVSMYGKCGRIMEARKVFVGLFDYNIVSWNAMLTAFINQGEVEHALLMYRQLKEEGVLPNDRTFVIALQACCILAEEYDTTVKGHPNAVVAMDIGQALHAEAQRRGYTLDSFVASTLIGMYSKCGNIRGAEDVFGRLVNCDVVAWTVMLSAYVDQGEGEKALQLYNYMQSRGMSPTQITFVNALQACCILAEKEAGVFLEGQHTKATALQIGHAMHDDVRRKGFESEIYINNILITLYGKCGSIVEAEEVFHGMLERNIVSWNSMLLAYMEQGQGEKAIKLYRQIQLEALDLDDVLLVCVLQACSETGSLEVCRQVHFVMASAGHEHTLLLETSLIHTYGSCASMEDAQAVFDLRPERDVVSWSALIAGYAQTGNYGASLQCYEKMQEAQVKPNEITFLSLLSVCSHMGLLEKGMEYFESMSSHHGLTHRTEHYITMIDLLGRTGNFARVQNFLAQAPMEPDLVLCHCLLSACLKYGNVELGKQAFKQAVFLQPKYAASYILMSNIYSKAGHYDCAKQLDASSQKGAWNNPTEHGR